MMPFQTPFKRKIVPHFVGNLQSHCFLSDPSKSLTAFYLIHQNLSKLFVRI